MNQLWKITDGALQTVQHKKLASEDMLEEWIVNDPSILGLDILIIARQYKKYHGKLDLLAMNSDGELIVIELKRDKTPRDVVAQTLDYASWVCNLSTKEIHEIAYQYKSTPLSQMYREHFGGCSLPDTLNTAHSMLIVASELDESSKRIIEYLAEEHKININTAFFSAFNDGSESYLVADWLMDEQQVKERASDNTKAPWKGYYFVNTGHGKTRSWNDMKQYGFVSAGGKGRYYLALNNLSVGDAIFTYVNGIGYVGYGIISHTVDSVANILKLKGNDLDKAQLEKPDTLSNYIEGDEESEYAVGVDWIKTYSLDEAKRFAGAFANQNVVCKLRHQATLDFLFHNFNVQPET